MRGLARGEFAATDAALNDHLDACLGCRGCEPVCPSGVRYGEGLEAARDTLVRARGLSIMARGVLAVFARTWLWKPILLAARLLRATGIPTRLAGRGRFGFAMGMVGASKASKASRASRASRMTGLVPARPARLARPARPANLFSGCVMQGLFSHVHRATGRALADIGIEMTTPRGQVCCGALHAHAGDLDGARALARRNLRAFGDDDTPVVVNSAGCGAMLKQYGHLLGTEAAARFAGRVRDVSEVLAGQRSTVNGRPSTVDQLSAVYDSPCHLQHAQGILAQPLALLAEVPGLMLRPLADSDKCCGSAGIFSLLEPAMSQAVLEAKLDAILAVDPAPDLVLTGNPGCLMQIGAGLLARGSSIRAAHPVELFAPPHD
jgi:glycolate oxidase iron-sulfur subunit